VPALALTWGEPRELVAEANRIYVFERLPHHLAILAMPQDEVTRRLARHGALLLTLLGFDLLSRRHFARSWSVVRGPLNMSNGPLTTDNGQHWLPCDALRTVNWFAWGAALLAAAGLMIELVFCKDPLRAASLLRFYWFRLTDFAVPMAVALQATSLVAAGIVARKAWAVWGLAAAIGLAGWHLSAASWHRLGDPVPPSDRRMRDYAAWVDVCEWVAGNTPPDAVFLTPRLAQSFKWRSGRPEVATYKDIPQDARDMVEWFHRLRTIYYEVVGGELEPVRSLGHLGTERVAALTHQYGARYVLTDHRRPLEFPVAYWNAEYVVYQIKP
jgi:hypothetical protein